MIWVITKPVRNAEGSLVCRALAEPEDWGLPAWHLCPAFTSLEAAEAFMDDRKLYGYYATPLEVQP